jgi:putative endopeptidase
MKRKIIALLLAATMLVSTGCSANVSMDENGNISVDGVPLGVIEDELFNELTEKNESKDDEGRTIDTSVMKPWINSTIHGVVTEDVNADLKDDFYLNVNHDWLANAKFRPGYADEMPILQAVDIIEERCLDILNDKSLKGDDAQRIQDFNELWLDWEGRNETGVAPLLPIAEKIQAVSTLDEMSELLVSKDLAQWGTTLAKTSLSLNAEDSSLFEVEIGVTSLTLGDPAEYKELTENGKRNKKASEEMATYMLSRIGLSDDEIGETLHALSDFETKIAGYEKTVLEKNDPEAVQEAVNPVTMEDIKKLSPNYPLAEFMENSGWAESKLINLSEPRWLEGLNEIYTEENLPGIKAYVLVNSIVPYIDSVDEEAFREYQRINNESRGVTESKPDKEIAYQAARESFPFCFDRIYVEKYLNEDIKKEITQLCQDAIDAYDEMLDTVDWLSDETRKEAQYKLRHIKINAVYPEKWDDDSMYTVTSKKDGGTYLQAVVDYKTATHEYDMSKLNEKWDKDIWLVDILETNAFYLPQDNSINIIPGFFCDATYQSDMSIEEKYGALGSVIGHEISHAFDTNGAQYDADGNLKNWWTDEDYKAFSDRAGKLIDYYDKVVAFDDGTPYQGQMVQTEAIADMAGLKCMLKMAEKIDDFDYDKFFRAHAFMWARSSTLEVCEEHALTDTHPIHYLRANVALAQFDEFQKTYGIEEGDGMYVAPEDRIAVW